MTPRSRTTPRSSPHAVARPHHRGWRGAAHEELALIRAWLRSGLTRGLEWLLQLGMPTAATVLEMQQVARPIAEGGEIKQAVWPLGARARVPPPIASTFDRSPFEE